ncbi:MAG: hypothetical protein HC880_06315 [Bacteroidia bacterium]|nr:hypothetical protein [Bacteroidia bacterium]
MKLIPQDDGTTLYEEIGSFDGEGSELKIVIPNNFFGEGILDWAKLALAINQGAHYDAKTNPFWYDSDSFYNLLLSTPEDIKMIDFLVYFDRMNRAKAKSIDEALRAFSQNMKSAPLSLPARTREEADLILEQLRSYAKEIPASKLGGVGTLEDFPAYVRTLSSFTLKTTKGKFDAVIPAGVEIYGRADGLGRRQVFVNKTPTTGDVDISYYEKRINLYGCGLSQVLECPRLAPNPSFWVNVMTPYMPIVSNGKEPDLSVLAEAIADSLRRVAGQLKKQAGEERTDSSLTREKYPLRSR